MTSMKSVSNALMVIESLADDGPAGVGELARRTGIAKSTVQRCLETLADRDWICRLEDTRGRELTIWQIGDRVATLATAFDADRLADIARPHMEQLRDATGEAVHLVVLDGVDVVLVERIAAPGAVQIVLPLGYRVPAYASATGKAMLSTLEPDTLAEHLPHELVGLTDATITSHAALREELAQIARRGWAANTGEWEGSVVAVAAPIGSGASLVGAVSVSMVPQRLDADRMPRLGTQVVETVERIARAQQRP